MPHNWSEKAAVTIPLNYEKFVKLECDFEDMNDEFIIAIDGDGTKQKLSLTSMSESAIDHIQDVIEQGEIEGKRIKVIVTLTHWKDGRITSRITYPLVRLTDIPHNYESNQKFESNNQSTKPTYPLN